MICLSSGSFDMYGFCGISVVIPEWRRITHQYPVPFYYTDTTFFWKMCNTELLPFGDRIVDATEAFMDALNIH